MAATAVERAKRRVETLAKEKEEVQEVKRQRQAALAQQVCWRCACVCVCGCAGTEGCMPPCTESDDREPIGPAYLNSNMG